MNSGLLPEIHTEEATDYLLRSIQNRDPDGAKNLAICIARHTGGLDWERIPEYSGRNIEDRECEVAKRYNEPVAWRFPGDRLVLKESFVGQIVKDELSQKLQHTEIRRRLGKIEGLLESEGRPHVSGGRVRCYVLNKEILENL